MVEGLQGEVAQLGPHCTATLVQGAVAASCTESGLPAEPILGRVHFSRGLSYLHQTAPEWTIAEMLPRFQEGHAEAVAMWKANAQARAGSASASFAATEAGRGRLLPAAPARPPSAQLGCSPGATTGPGAEARER